MMINKIPVPQDTWLVLIITDKNNQRNHSINYLNKHGNLVTDSVIVTDARAYEVIRLIPHMMKIHFTSDITEYIPNISSVFNRLDKNEEIGYTGNMFAWQLNPNVVPVIREYCKLLHVYNYENTTEYEEKAHRITDWLNDGNSEDTLELLRKAVV